MESMTRRCSTAKATSNECWRTSSVRRPSLNRKRLPDGETADSLRAPALVMRREQEALSTDALMPKHQGAQFTPLATPQTVSLAACLPLTPSAAVSLSMAVPIQATAVPASASPGTASCTVLPSSAPTTWTSYGEHCPWRFPSPHTSADRASIET